MTDKLSSNDVTKEVTGVTYAEYMPQSHVFIRDEATGSIEVPFLTGRRLEDGSVSLTLDRRLGLDLPASLEPHVQDAIVEFVANAIAVGAGYPSIYYTDRGKLAFR